MKWTFFDSEDASPNVTKKTSEVTVPLKTVSFQVKEKIKPVVKQEPLSLAPSQPTEKSKDVLQESDNV